MNEFFSLHIYRNSMLTSALFFYSLFLLSFRLDCLSFLSFSSPLQYFFLVFFFFMNDLDDPLSGDETEEEEDNRPAHEKSRFCSCSRLVTFKFKASEAGGIHTEPFSLGGYSWTLFYFPKGNDGAGEGKFSLFLRSADDYPRSVSFQLTAKNHHLGKNDYKSNAAHVFTKDNPDWGFSSFMDQKDMDPSTGFLTKRGELHILVELGVLPRVKSRLAHQIRNGFIQDHGNSSLNSLVQVLYHLPYVRLAVYKIPISIDGERSLPSTLQVLFSRLQFRRSSSPLITTENLSKFFGTTAKDNIGEFNRTIYNSLRRAMKGTVAEGTMEKLFWGEFANFTRCVHVKYESEVCEEFHDLSLPIEGCGNLYDSFRKFVATSRLRGKNRFFAPGYGLQDAERGIRFKSFPEVLILNLARFKQISSTEFEKVDDEMDFPRILDVKEFLDPLTRDDVSTIYHLHAVLSLARGGEHIVSLRPTAGPQWFFLNGKGGIPRGESSQFRLSDAMTLVYVRDSSVNDIFMPVRAGDIPLALQQGDRVEQEDDKEVLDVVIVTDAMLMVDKQERFDMIGTRFEELPRMGVNKETTVGEFRKKYAEENGIDDPEKLLFWSWMARKNKTHRVDFPLLDMDLKFKTMERYDKAAGNTIIRLFMMISERPEPPFFQLKQNLIFFKYFDIVNQQLRHIGHASFDRSDLVSNFIPIAKKLALLEEYENIRLYEEVRPSRLDPLTLSDTLLTAELVSGDIIIIEKEENPLEFPRIEEFIQQGLSITVQIKPLESPSDSGFPLSLSSDTSYRRVAQLVGEKVSWPGDRIGLFTSPVNPDYMAPINCHQRLSDLIQDVADRTLYFQKLDMTLDELMTMIRICSR